MKRKNLKFKEIDNARIDEPDRSFGFKILIPSEYHFKILEFLPRHGMATFYALSAVLYIAIYTTHCGLYNYPGTGYLKRPQFSYIIHSKLFKKFEPSHEISEIIFLSKKSYRSLYHKLTLK